MHVMPMLKSIPEVHSPAILVYLVRFMLMRGCFSNNKAMVIGA